MRFRLGLGFLAQEVATVPPEAVNDAGDAFDQRPADRDATLAEFRRRLDASPALPNQPR